jgi:3-oxoacyl-[acyl-carrier-protein] synthase II
MLDARQVLVTVGTPCSMSAVGSTETHRATVLGLPTAIGFAAFDAGLVDIDLQRSTAAKPVFIEAASNTDAGRALSLGEIESRFGARLRAGMGVRQVARDRLAPHVLSDIAAPLPHDLEEHGLRQRMGLRYEDVRASSFKDMFGLFDDDPKLGPSLQAQLFLWGGLGALAALPKPLRELCPAPHRFRIAAATAFHGTEAVSNWRYGMQPQNDPTNTQTKDKFAFRLAGALASHGPGLVNCMLAPAFNLSRVMRNPALLGSLRLDGQSARRVPQAPLTSMGACASSSIAFCEIAPQMVLDYPGHPRPDLVLWTAADAVLRPDFSVLEAFGIGAMMSKEKLDAMNASRPEGERRTVADSLAPFDIDAQGTVVGNAGSGLFVTTLEFALRNFLDVTSIVVGWGQSGETGGKGHFAGVGFGGENALLFALDMARQGHGYGVADFRHFVAHATGTRTNSKTDLSTAHAARVTAAEDEGFKGPLPVMTVGAPKAVGDGHSMGETGLKAVGEAIQYLLGNPTVGVPTLRRKDPDLGPAAEFFSLEVPPVPGNADGGALTATQGFGGYDGALALRAANPDALRRYKFSDPRILDAYLERWTDLRTERTEREARWRRTRAFARLLAEQHRWPGGEG